MNTVHPPLSEAATPPPALFHGCAFVSALLSLGSRQMASLRRQQGGMGAGPTERGAQVAKTEGAASWDTPVARELRAKIKSLEREARKREIVLQVTGWGRSAKGAAPRMYFSTQNICSFCQPEFSSRAKHFPVFAARCRSSCGLARYYSQYASVFVAKLQPVFWPTAFA